MATLDMKITRLSAFPHLKASGKGRLVRSADGIVVGYVKTKWGGIRSIGATSTGKHDFHYFGVDGMHVVNATLDGIKLALTKILPSA